MYRRLCAVCRALRDHGRSHPTQYWKCGTSGGTRRSTGPPGQAGHSADGVLQLFNPTPTIPAPLLTFEGMSNQDNFNIFGFRVNPPDPNGDVGPNNYVEMINLVFAVYRQGRQLAGGTDRYWLALGRVSDSKTALIPRATRLSCTTRYGSLDPVAVHDARIDGSNAALLQLRGDFDRPAIQPAPTIATLSSLKQTRSMAATSSLTTRSTALDELLRDPNDTRLRVSNRGTGSAFTRSRRTRWSNGEPNARAVQFFLEGNVIPTCTCRWTCRRRSAAGRHRR